MMSRERPMIGCLLTPLMNNNYLAQQNRDARSSPTISLISRNLQKKYPNHAGIILAKQKKLSIGETITALDNLLREAEADTWQGQARWLNDWT
jgi:hypothetical protein